MTVDRVLCRLCSFLGSVGCSLHLFIHRLFQSIDLFFVENIFPDQKHLHAGDGIALRIFLALAVRAVETLVVRERMRIRTNHMPVHQCRTLTGAAIPSLPFAGSVTTTRTGTVTFFM